MPQTTYMLIKMVFFIDIYHVPSGRSVQFKAFVTQFDDQYNSEFGSEEVFGRMDSIQVYKGTTRQIGLSWDVPSASEFEAVNNMNKCSELMNMLYPVYTKAAAGKVLNAPPVFKIKFANLIRNAGGLSHGAGGNAQTSGLFGTIGGFSYSPDMTSGFLEIPIDGEVNLIPQTISLSCTFTVMHTHDLGFESADGRVTKINDFYPFSTGKSEQSSPNSVSPGSSEGPGAEINAANNLDILAAASGDD